MVTPPAAPHGELRCRLLDAGGACHYLFTHLSDYTRCTRLDCVVLHDWTTTLPHWSSGARLVLPSCALLWLVSVLYINCVYSSNKRDLIRLLSCLHFSCLLSHSIPAPPSRYLLMSCRPGQCVIIHLLAISFFLWLFETGLSHLAWYSPISSICLQMPLFYHSLWLSNIPLYIYDTVSLSIQQLKGI